MLTYLRYALATFCFAASVVFLAWWSRSGSYQDMVVGPAYILPATGLFIESSGRIVTVSLLLQGGDRLYPSEWHRLSNEIDADHLEGIQHVTRRLGRFEFSRGNLFFPLWYPALIFALAGVAALCFRR